MKIDKSTKRFLLFLVVNALSLICIFIVSEELSRLRIAGAISGDNTISTANTNEVSRLLAMQAEQEKLEAEQQKLQEIIRKQEIASRNGQKVEEYLTKNGIENSYAIYFQDLNQPEIRYTFNETVEFAPASLYKVPLSMIVLKQVETGELNLNDAIAIGGKIYTIQESIRMMMQDSANEPMTPLENKLGGYNSAQKMINDYLGVKVVRIGQDSNAESLARVFELLYKPQDQGGFLEREYSKLILDYLETSAVRNRDRIPKAVSEFSQENLLNEPLRAATKIGNLTGVYQDGGIVYGNESDYVLIVLNKNRINVDPAIEVRAITKLLLDDLE